MSARARHDLAAVLREAHGWLARPHNDFAWSPWDDAATALRELGGLIARIDAGDMPDRSDVELLFLPTGPIQEVAESSGWGEEFIALAERFDRALAAAYGSGLLARARALASPRR